MQRGGGQRKREDSFYSCLIEFLGEVTGSVTSSVVCEVVDFFFSGWKELLKDDLLFFFILGCHRLIWGLESVRHCYEELKFFPIDISG